MRPSDSAGPQVLPSVWQNSSMTANIGDLMPPHKRWGQEETIQSCWVVKRPVSNLTASASNPPAATFGHCSQALTCRQRPTQYVSPVPWLSPG